VTTDKFLQTKETFYHIYILILEIVRL